MSVNSVLKKICDHNSLVMGCMAGKDDMIFREFDGINGVLNADSPNSKPFVIRCSSGIEGEIDVDAMHESAENIFVLMDNLGAGEGAFDQFFLEFNDYSIAARKLDEGVLVLVTKPIDHTTFRKTQVGINLFLKPLNRALKVAVAPEIAPVVPVHTGSGGFSRLYRSFAA